MTGSNVRKNVEFNVHELGPAQIGQAVSILSAALDKDPVIAYYLNDPERRKKAFRIFFDNVIRAQLKFRHVYAASIGDKVSGVAVWRPPDAAGDTPEDLSRDKTAHLQLGKLFPLTAEEMLQGFEGLGAFHPAEPHWYLYSSVSIPIASGWESAQNYFLRLFVLPMSRGCCVISKLPSLERSPSTTDSVSKSPLD